MQPSNWQVWVDDRNRRGFREPAEALAHCACPPNRPRAPFAPPLESDGGMTWSMVGWIVIGAAAALLLCNGHQNLGTKQSQNKV
jgi:hypothetical protein